MGILGLIIGFVIAIVVGFRRGAVTGPSVVGIAAISLFLAVVGVVQSSAMQPWTGEPSVLRFAVGFMLYFIPLMAGFALGAAAKKQRLKNDAEANDSAR